MLIKHWIATLPSPPQERSGNFAILYIYMYVYTVSDVCFFIFIYIFL